jgi:hypothetical protein
MFSLPGPVGTTANYFPFIAHFGTTGAGAAARALVEVLWLLRDPNWSKVMYTYKFIKSMK